MNFPTWKTWKEVKFSYIWCSKCPSCSRTHDRRRSSCPGIHWVSYHPAVAAQQARPRSGVPGAFTGGARFSLTRIHDIDNRRRIGRVWLKSGRCLTKWSSTGPSSSSVYVYGRVSVNKEDILNTGYSWISLPFRFSMLESSIFWCCILNAHNFDKLTNISNRF